MPGLIKGPGLSLTSGLAYYNAMGYWSGGAGFIAPSSFFDKLGLYFTRGQYWLNEREYSAVTSVPGWTFSGGTTTNGLDRYAEDASGNLVAFPSGVPRITDKGFLVEEARTNLLLQSQSLANVVWSATNLTATDNSLTAPDGTTTADLLNEGTGTGVHSVAQTFSATSGQSYVFSAYLKNGTRRYAQLFFGSAGHGSTAYANFDLQSGLVGTTGAGTSASIQALGGGWYRCVIVASATATTSSASAQIGMITAATSARAESYAGSSNTLYAWQTDLSAASFPTSPIVTTTAAATRAADNASITGLSGILGQFRTNLLTYSQQFDNAAWVNSNNTVAADAVVAPDGTTTADKISQTAVTNAFNTQQTPVAAYQSGQAYTGSVYAKMGTQRYVQLTFSSAAFGGTQYANVDLQTGTVGTTAGGATLTPTDAGNGWWRLAYTATATANTTAPFFIFQVQSNTSVRVESFAGSTSNYIYLWGAQLETGSTATAYIPTTNAAASAGNPVTLVAWFSIPDSNISARRFGRVVGISNAVFNFFELNNFSTIDDYFSGTNNTATLGASGTANSIIKVANRVRATERALVGNAGAISARAGAATASTGITLGQRQNAGEYLNGYIQRVQILGDTTDSQLTQLTVGP